ncbi:MAG: molybdate transport system substrate-binding protein [Solirubrobacterales bacterium]|jgi:molybdate transport system substrate-binding protein|nr:molybdate transport system substrate-binding protein [Solirubrobacterales bacterium]
MAPAMMRLAALLLAALGALAAAGCGDSTPVESPGPGPFVHSATITVAAPTPLDKPFNAYASSAKLNTQISFAGSDFHADQIRAGNKPDLYVADDTSLPDGLFDDGLVQEPVPFATDELVLAVPKDSKIESLDDLTADGVRVAIGQEGLPVGDYAREALSGLPDAESQAILANVSSEESTNNGIVLKLTQGRADAGLVYATDVKATGGKLRAIELPARLRPEVVYAGAVVEGSENPAGAQHFLDDQLHGKGAQMLQRAGFGPPPG